jgi:hypothetical protein
MVNTTSDSRATWDGVEPIRAPASLSAANLEELRFQTVIGKCRARFNAMGFPIVPTPMKPILIAVVEEK